MAAPSVDFALYAFTANSTRLVALRCLAPLQTRAKTARPVAPFFGRRAMRDMTWTGGDLPTFVTHLECGLTGERYEADVIQGLSKAGRPLLVRYDLPGVAKALSKDMLAARPQTLWRYRELLPVRRPGNIVSLGEIVTPLIALPR